VSRFQKIFLASALVVVGFVVAKFLGQPVLPQQLVELSRPQPNTARIAIQSSSPPASSPRANARVQLLPESPVPAVTAQSSNIVAPAVEVPSLGSAIASPISSDSRTTISETPRAPVSAAVAFAPFDDKDQPRAKLRVEAPRPIGVDPQSPASIRRNSTLESEPADPYRVVNSQPESSAWAAPQLLNTGYAQSESSSPPAVAASYIEPPRPTVENQVSPPPWPRVVETAEPRTHIVVDGDSLERLAGRYLSDPQRSREIFELNRQVLSAPDLLPIGAELKIPERLASASWGRKEFQPNSASTQFNRESSRDTWTPVRPAASPQGIIPRAQLAPPVMVQ
jgi:nucleoid-associated protein YgaU